MASKKRVVVAPAVPAQPEVAKAPRAPRPSRARVVVEVVDSPEVAAAKLVEDRKLVERVDLFGRGLSETERNFVESFKKWLESGKPLTTKQRAVGVAIDERRVDR